MMNECRYKCKKRHVCEKDYASNPATCNCENGKYLASIMDDSAIAYDEIVESYDEDAKAKLCDETNFNDKNATCKRQKFYVLLTFLSITVALMTAVTI